MGRPPCCDKLGVKKGPWTPEEDIILVSYIQKHGPGNWRAVPTNTGLLRCSKSCRLRWTNYLRPGIHRGSFTDQDERMIIHLQALLGNRWAAIASYMPQRTDNDIKNYWNTHLKKKLKKMQCGGGDGKMDNNNNDESRKSKGQWERRLQADIHTAKQALCEALSTDNNTVNNSTTFLGSYLSPNATLPQTITKTSSSSCSGVYASSTENISKLLQNWIKKSPTSAKSESSHPNINHVEKQLVKKISDGGPSRTSSSSSDGALSATTVTNPFDSIFGMHGNSDDIENGNFCHDHQSARLFNDTDYKPDMEHGKSHYQQPDEVPLTLLDKWSFEDHVNAPSHGCLDICSVDDASVFF